MRHPCLPLLICLTTGRIAAQDTTPAAPPVPPVFQVLSESTVRQPDGGSTTFREVAPPVVTPLAQPASAPTTASQAAGDEPPEKECLVLGISASVKASGHTVLRWICGASQRLQAVSNVDFRALAGLGGLETAQTRYVLILAAGPDEEPLTEAEATAAQSLSASGSASYALLGSSPAATTPADEAALHALEALLDYYDTHRQELLQQQAQREADRAARELAARNAPPPPPRRSIVHFWPLQPAQRTAIQSNTQGGKREHQP